MSRSTLEMFEALGQRVWRWLPNTPTWDALAVSIADGEISDPAMLTSYPTVVGEGDQ